MDSENERIRYEVEIAEEGEHFFQHMFPYAKSRRLKTKEKKRVRLEIHIPEDMRQTFEESLKQNFGEAVCDMKP